MERAENHIPEIRIMKEGSFEDRSMDQENIIGVVMNITKESFETIIWMAGENINQENMNM